MYGGRDRRFAMSDTRPQHPKSSEDPKSSEVRRYWAILNGARWYVIIDSEPKKSAIENHGADTATQAGQTQLTGPDL